MYEHLYESTAEDLKFLASISSRDFKDRKWEHKLVNVTGNDIEEILDEIGLFGWEVCGQIGSLRGKNFELIVKRPLIRIEHYR